MKEALQDSGERDEIKKVNVLVGAIYDGTRFSIKVDIDYIQNDEPFFPSPDQPLPDDTLHGRLQVFMVEDNITAYSKVLDDDGEEDPYVLVHNVFREYAIQDYDFELQPGDSLNDIFAEWDIPTTMIQDEDEGEIPIKIPVNPANVFPVAVVYDLDDRDSGRGDGSENSDGDGGEGTPRALNSATPATTAYDLDNFPPEIELLEPTSKDGKIQINAQITDDGGELTAAFTVYREVGKTDAQWRYKALTIDGTECDDDVCTIGSGEAYAVLNIKDSEKVKYSIIAYDGNWTKGNSEMAVAKISSSDDDDISTLMVGGVLGILVLIGVGLYYMNSQAQVEDGSEEGFGEDFSEEGSDYEEEAYAEEVREYTWNEFRSINRGRPKDEVSKLWKEYKDNQ